MSDPADEMPSGDERRCRTHGGKRPNSGAKKHRPNAVRTISVQLGAAEDALLTRLELQWREPAAEVMRRGLVELAKREGGG